MHPTLTSSGGVEICFFMHWLSALMCCCSAPSYNFVSTPRRPDPVHNIHVPSPRQFAMLSVSHLGITTGILSPRPMTRPCDRLTHIWLAARLRMSERSHRPRPFGSQLILSGHGSRIYSHLALRICAPRRSPVCPRASAPNLPNALHSSHQSTTVCRDPAFPRPLF